MGCQRDIAQQIVDQRYFAFNLLRGDQGDRYSIPRCQRLCDWDLAYRLKVLQSAVCDLAIALA